jgi:beta-lactam-binding protein with PASTA domain
MYKSAGNEKITIEDYTGEDSNKIQAKLELAGLNVLIENKDVDDKDAYTGKESIIIDQSVEKGTKLTVGDSITLYIPNLPEEYPNFVTEGYSLKQVQSWCKENNILLTVEEEESSITPGTIIYQSRTAGSEVVSGADLTIKIAIEKTVIEDNTENKEVTTE